MADPFHSVRRRFYAVPWQMAGCHLLVSAKDCVPMIVPVDLQCVSFGIQAKRNGRVDLVPLSALERKLNLLA